jgi:inward rectifier potassium channel
MARERVRTQKERTLDGEEVTVLGAPSETFGDAYHWYLRAPWWRALLSIVSWVVGLDAVFAVIYYVSDGVKDARPGSFFDCFAFSVETMSTIGYGEMQPATPFAHGVVMVQAIVGLMMTALATGLVFAKFAQPSARIQFSERVLIGHFNDVPTLSFRVGNARGNRILEAMVRVTFVRTETHRDGTTFYRMYDLPLTRERSPALTRSWLAMHTIDEKSFFHEATPEMLEKDEVELLVTVIRIAISISIIASSTWSRSAKTAPSRSTCGSST